MNSSFASEKDSLEGCSALSSEKPSADPEREDASTLEACQTRYGAVGDENTCTVDKEQEMNVREKALHNPIYLLVVNMYSVLVTFVLHLVSLETLLCMGLTAGLTVYVYNERVILEDYNGSIMEWTLLTFAVVIPITDTIKLAFTRREDALLNVSIVRSTLLELYAAHANWDWGYTPGASDSGRKRSTIDWISHSDKVCGEVLYIGDELTRWLTLPSSTRARHRATRPGKREAAETEAVAFKIYDSILIRMGRLSELCEVLKREGLPPNEATRIRQWERMVLQSIERLRMTKQYRTPQALRSFARLFSIFLPPFYSPFHAQVAHDLNSLGMGIAFGLITALALTALFETVTQMEDPFVNSSFLDGVHVHHDLVIDFVPRILTLRNHFFPQAPKFRDAPTQEVDSSHDLQSEVRILHEY